MEEPDIWILRKEGTNMEKTDFALMDDIMQGVSGSSEWNQIQLNDPDISEKQTQLDGIMQQVKGYLPRDLYATLSEAQTAAATAYIEPAILYGIRVANVVRDVAAHPVEFSEYVQARMRREVAV